jgi:hypothetical protein
VASVLLYNEPMSNRLILFNNFKNHAWLSRVFDRLKNSDLDIAIRFIETNDHLDIGNFELAINRMFLDKEKPRRYKEILELLTCANSALRQHQIRIAKT